jgi:SAM-dependent methyltransferase
MFRTTCMVCESADLETIMNLGMHPFADTFVVPERESEADRLYQLACDMCAECGHIQARCETDPEARYSEHDYSYTSSNSAFSRGHWEKYAVEVGRANEVGADAVVIEVGSNDGYLLEQFRKQGAKVLGIDAAPAVASLAEERGIETMVGLFDAEMADRARAKVGAAKLVVANNVFNHADDVIGFAQAAASLLAPDGTFVFELPYWCIGVRDGHFDQIYHEHVSYLTARSSKRIAEAAGLYVHSIEVVDYHGGSLRVSTRLAGPDAVETPDLVVMIAGEEAEGMFSVEMYRDFMAAIVERRNQFLEKVYSLKNAGVPVVAVGAAAKGNTMLNFYRLDHSVVDYVTDISPFKQGKMTPGTRIPITGDEVLGEYTRVAALILSWNIADTLKKTLLGINPDIEFLHP